MKIILSFIILFWSISANSQALTIKNLMAVLDNNYEYFDSLVNKKGFKYENSIKRDSSTTYNYIKEPTNNGSLKIEIISYSNVHVHNGGILLEYILQNKKQFDALRKEIKDSNFKFTGETIIQEHLCLTYEKNGYIASASTLNHEIYGLVYKIFMTKEKLKK